MCSTLCTMCSSSSMGKIDGKFNWHLCFVCIYLHRKCLNVSEQKCGIHWLFETSNRLRNGLKNEQKSIRNERFSRFASYIVELNMLVFFEQKKYTQCVFSELVDMNIKFRFELIKFMAVQWCIRQTKESRIRHHHWGSQLHIHHNWIEPTKIFKKKSDRFNFEQSLRCSYINNVSVTHSDRFEQRIFHFPSLFPVLSCYYKKKGWKVRC